MLTAKYKYRIITADEANERKFHIERPELLDPYEGKYKVDFVNSEKYIKHFRYHPKSRPEWHIKKYGKSESESHLNGKYYIYNYLLNLGRNVQMEYKIGNRIADVCDVDKKQVYEIEVGNISEKDLYNRSKDYAKNGYTVFWYVKEWKEIFNEHIPYILFRLLIKKSGIYVNYYEDRAFLLQ